MKLVRGLALCALLLMATTAGAYAQITEDQPPPSKFGIDKNPADPPPSLNLPAPPRKGDPSEEPAPLNSVDDSASQTEVVGACAEGWAFIGDDDLVALIRDDLETTQKAKVPTTRYLTLTNLYNACVPDAELEVFRQGVVKLLNSLSRAPDVVRLETIDAPRTIIRFNLRDLGWEPDDWTRVVSVYPYATRPASSDFDTIAASTDTPLPYVRADWFAYAASQPPLYHKLAGIPETFAELQTRLGVNVAINIWQATAKRAGFAQSGVALNNRLIERHPIATGYMWLAYDFADSAGPWHNLLESPLGPGIGRYDFRHDSLEALFSLPNGFQAYMLATADGRRLDKGPMQIVRDLTRKDLAVSSGVSCINCHDRGIRPARDSVRAVVTADPGFPDDVRDAVEALYPAYDEMTVVMDRDQQAFLLAMSQAGLDPDLKLNGLEPVNALTLRYESDLDDLVVVAAELGVERETLEERIASAIGGRDNALTRLQQRLAAGAATRDAFENEFLDLAESVSDARRIEVAAAAPEPPLVPACDPAGNVAGASDPDFLQTLLKVSQAVPAEISDGTSDTAQALSRLDAILRSIAYVSSERGESDPSGDERVRAFLTAVGKALGEREPSCRSLRIDAAVAGLASLRSYFEESDALPAVIGVATTRRPASGKVNVVTLSVEGFNLRDMNVVAEIDAAGARVVDRRIQDSGVAFDILVTLDQRPWINFLQGRIVLDRHVSWLMPYDRWEFPFVATLAEEAPAN
jgi:hypothetical protein